MHDIINRNIPTKLIKSCKDLPWLNHSIKRRNHLYIRAKCTQSISDWTAYKQLKNEINNLMSKAHEDYCKHLFDNSFCESRKQFWSLIKSLWKDHSGIASLNVNGTCLTDPMDKAEALNKQFFTFFTNEDRHVPTLESSPFPNIQELYLSIDGISCILKNLQTNKAPGPDEIPVYILKLCNEELHQYYRLFLPRV